LLFLIELYAPAIFRSILQIFCNHRVANEFQVFHPQGYPQAL